MVFGPVMLVWFAVISLLGARQVAIHPDILRALSPVYGMRLLAESSLGSTLRVLGAVMLAVTGCEAMYADMGHFGASAIRKSWFAIVFPALLRVAIRVWHWNVALSLLLILPLAAGAGADAAAVEPQRHPAAQHHLR